MAEGNAFEEAVKELIAEGKRLEEANAAVTKAADKLMGESSSAFFTKDEILAQVRQDEAS